MSKVQYITENFGKYDVFSIEDYMNRAFRDDAEEGNREKLKANMALFNSYACSSIWY